MRGKSSSFPISEFKDWPLFQKMLLLSIFFLEAGTFFAIPACSFTSGLNLVTWGLTIGLLAAMVGYVLLFGSVFIDSVVVSFLVFCIMAFAGSLLNGFKNFTFTPILLVLCSCVFYLFLKNDKRFIKYFIFAAYLGEIAFLLLYFFKYRIELLHMDFSRLGGIFGDENDIALILGIGMALSLGNLLYLKNVAIKIVSFFLMALFAYCGLSTGSKCFLLTGALVFVVSIILFFGRKKWWLSLVVIFAGLLLVLALLQLPFLSSLKSRVDSMLATLVGHQVDGNTADWSTKSRMLMFLDGIQMWLRKPLLGYGIRGFYRASSFGGSWSHNNFSESLVSFGLIGTVAYHWAYASSFISLKTKKNIGATEKQLILILFFFIAAMFSVALNSQKIYSYLIAAPIAGLSRARLYRQFECNFLRRKIKNHPEIL